MGLGKTSEYSLRRNCLPLRELSPDPLIHSPGDEQYEYFQLISIPELLSHPQVHAHTRNYFVPNAPNLFLGAAHPVLSPRPS